MASKHFTALRPFLPSSPSTSFSSELIEHSTTMFQKSPLYVLEEQEGYWTTLGNIQQTVLWHKFTSFMFPPFLVSIAGALTKPKSAHLGLYKARLNSDVVIRSTGGSSNTQGILSLRLVPGSQLSLLWRTPWTCATCSRGYGSAAESRKSAVRVSDEDEADDDNNGDAGELSEPEDDYDVEDEQRIEDSDDEEEEEDQEPQSQEPVKKKVQTKPPKSKLPDQQGRVLNERIMARTLRLVNDDGKGHRVVSRDEALTLAKQKHLDLVLVDARADPPVCKIYDYNREEYKQEQILKDRKKKKGAMAHLSEVKELRFNSKTELKDLKMKVEKAKEFMDRGYRVKFVAIFKSKIDDEKERLKEEKMIDAISQMMEDVAVIEQGPRVESRQAWVLLRHVKFASKKKPPKQAKNVPTDEVETVEHEDQVHSEPDFFQGQEENVMYAQNSSSMSEEVPMGRMQGYPSTMAATPTQPFVFQRPNEAFQDTSEGFSSKVHSPPSHGFPEHTQSPKGFGGLEGFKRPAPGPLSSTPTILKGIQSTKMQNSHPGASPLPASNLQGFKGSQIEEQQSSPLDGLLPPQSEHQSLQTPKIQRFSVHPQSQGSLSQRQSPNDAPCPEKAIGSEVTQGMYPPVTSRGRGILPPNQPPNSLFSSTPPTSLRGPPSNLQGSLLNLSQSPPTPATHNRGPLNFQGPLSNLSSSPSVPSSHQGGSSDLEGPLIDFFSSPPSATPQPAPSVLQGPRLDPSPFPASQNAQEKYSQPLQGSEGSPPQGLPGKPLPSSLGLEGLPPQGVPRKPLPSSLGLEGLPPQGVPRKPPPSSLGFEGFPPQGVPRPPIGQPRYPPPFGKPSFPGSQLFQGEHSPGNQNHQLQGQMQGPDGSSFTHQMRLEPRSTLNLTAPNISQQQNYGPEQGQDSYAPPRNAFGSAQRPQQGSPNLFGAPQYPQQGQSNIFGSPPQRPQNGFPGLFGSPPHPQQGPSNLFGSPPHQQGPSSLFGSPPHQQQGPPQPSQIQFGYQPAGVPQGPRQGSPWLSQQAPPRCPSPMPPHPQQTGQPPSQGHQGYFAQQEPPQGGHWQGSPSQQNQALKGYSPQAPQGYSPQKNQAPEGHPPQQNQAPQGYPPQQYQAPQGYPPQQYQAPQGYPPQRGFPQTRLAQGTFGFPQNQAFQGSPPPRGLPQTRPVVPPPHGFRPSWSTPPQSQEYSPLFEPPSDKT